MLQQNNSILQIIEEYAPVTFWSINGIVFIIACFFVAKVSSSKQRPNKLFWILILFVFGIIGCNIVTAFYFCGLDIMWSRISTYLATSFLIISFLFFSHNTFRILFAHDHNFGPYVRFSQIMLIIVACLLTVFGIFVPVFMSFFPSFNGAVFFHAAYLLSVPLFSGLVILPSWYNMYQLSKIRTALSFQLSGNPIILLLLIEFYYRNFA